MKNITIKDIAEKCDISYTTVSRALTGKPGVNPATRKKIIETAQLIGYRPNAIARSLVTNRSKTIALMIPEICNPFFSDIAYAVDETANQNGYTTIIFISSWDENIEQEKLALLQEKRVDGIILRPVHDDATFYKDINIPVVLLTYLPEYDISSIEVENFVGGYDGVTYLISRGYKNIGFIGGKQHNVTTKGRYEGYLKSLEENRMPINPGNVRFGDYTLENGYKSATELLTSSTPPDALFCCNDLIALGVWQKASELGIHVPSQLGIIGFDDTTMASLPLTKLTTFAQPREQIGQLAANLLIESIHKQPEKITRKILLKPKLIIRNSTR